MHGILLDTFNLHDIHGVCIYHVKNSDVDCFTILLCTYLTLRVLLHILTSVLVYMNLCMYTSMVNECVFMSARIAHLHVCILVIWDVYVICVHACVHAHVCIHVCMNSLHVFKSAFVYVHILILSESSHMYACMNTHIYLIIDV